MFKKGRLGWTLVWLPTGGFEWLLRWLKWGSLGWLLGWLIKAVLSVIYVVKKGQFFAGY